MRYGCVCVPLHTEKLHFPDFGAGDASQLLVQQLEREYSLELEGEAAAALQSLMQEVWGGAGVAVGRVGRGGRWQVRVWGWGLGRSRVAGQEAEFHDMNWRRLNLS